MTDAFVGTWTMVRLALRRDRWILTGWIVGFATLAGSSAASTAALYPDVSSRVEAAGILNASAALVALYGRVYDPASLGAISLIKLTAFGSALIAILMMFVVVRHTRAEEESGRLELVSAGRLGRSATLTAALVVAFGASLVLGLLTTLWLIAAGLAIEGSLAFGLGWAATGMVFATVGGVVAQLSSSSRAVRGLGLVVIAVTYALRALGDLAEPGPSVLSWLSPIGWTQQVRAFAGDRWWVLALPLLLAVVLVPVAYLLRARRDLGAGLLPDRPGPVHGSLASPWGLAWRLQGRALLAWVVALGLGGLVLGSIASSITDLITSEQMRRFLEGIGGGQALIDTFIGAELGILGVVAAAFGVSAAAHLRSEETEGRAELLLSTATSRLRWAASHVAVAVIGVAVLMLVVGVAMGVATSLSLHDGSQFGRVLVVALAQIPAAWAMTALVIALFGWLPRATALAWGLLAAFVALGEFGQLWKAPSWLMDASPFQHTPLLPLTAAWAAPLVGLILVAAAVAVLGFAGWRRRDTPV